jgi:hypothetical protein
LILRTFFTLQVPFLVRPRPILDPQQEHGHIVLKLGVYQLGITMKGTGETMMFFYELHGWFLQQIKVLPSGYLT